MEYTRARDFAWSVLIEHGISELPVDVRKICRERKITLLTYKQSVDFIKTLGLEAEVAENDAFCLESVIFYNDEMPPRRQRFSIAHELGHILLHTGDKNQPAAYNREPYPECDPIETEANVFAARLLAPLCVIQFLNLNSANEISEYCDISYTAAQNRFKRLCEVRARSSRRKRTKNHGTFLLSSLERRVAENFKVYIERNKKQVH